MLLIKLGEVLLAESLRAGRACTCLNNLIHVDKKKPQSISVYFKARLCMLNVIATARALTEGEWSGSATVQQGCHIGISSVAALRSKVVNVVTPLQMVQCLSDWTHRDSVLGDVWGLRSTTADGTPGSEGLRFGGPRMVRSCWLGRGVTSANENEN